MRRGFWHGQTGGVKGRESFWEKWDLISFVWGVVVDGFGRTRVWVDVRMGWDVSA